MVVPKFYVEDIAKMSSYHCCLYLLKVTIEKMIEGSEHLGKAYLKGWLCLRMAGCLGFSLETY